MESAGDLVSGRFRLVSELGSGGFARVYLAEDLPSGRLAALKLLRPEFAASPTARESFRREALATLKVRHPNIATVVAIGVHDGDQSSSPWIAYEYVPGRTLRRVVEERGPVSPAVAAAVAQGALLALRAAHRVGLAHRDVSPSNVMLVDLDEDGARAPLARLLDFGLVGLVGHSALGRGLRGEPALFGNPHFVSPEHALGQRVDGRGDLYQLAATLFFALTGRPPFSGATTAEIIQAHLTSPVPRPSDLDSSIPAEWGRFLVRGLAKQPHARFPDADAMLAALDGLSRLVHDRSPAASSGSRVLVGSAPDLHGRSAAPDATLALPATTATARLPAPPVAAGDVTMRLPLASVESAQRAGRRPPMSRYGPGTMGARATAAARLLVTAALAAAIALGWVLAETQPPSAPPYAEEAVGSSSPTIASTEPRPATATADSRDHSGASPSAVSDRNPAEAAEDLAEVVVPDLVGRTLPDARQALAAAGLTVGAVETVLSSLPGDTVIRLLHPVGSAPARGAAVDLIVASGSNVVPDIIGTELVIAASAIQDAGFEVELHSVAASALSGGRVVDADPEAGTVVRLGSPVVVTFAPLASPVPTPSPPLPE